MPYILLFSLTLLFSACTSTPEPSPKTAKTISNNTPSSTQQAPIKDLSFEGQYLLQEGMDAFQSRDDAITKTFTSGQLVIEKLDDDDYGYYATVQVGTLTPEGYYGIFHKKNGKFYQKFVDEKTMQTELRDSLIITPNDKGIKILLKTVNGNKLFIWEKDFSGILVKSQQLQKIEHDYIQVYRDKFSQFMGE